MNDNRLYKMTDYKKLPEVFGPWATQNSGASFKPTRHTDVLHASRTFDFQGSCQRTDTEQRYHQILAALTDEQRSAVAGILLPLPVASRAAIIRAVTASIIQAERAGNPIPAEKFLVGLRTVSPRLYQLFATEPQQALQRFYLIFGAEHRNLMRAIRQQATLLPPEDLPEVTAVNSGPDGIRAYIAAGGTWHNEVIGDTTIAHYAAMSTVCGPDTLAAFIQTGGTFHSIANRSCRSTPLHELILSADQPETLYRLAETGIRVNPQDADTGDAWGRTPRQVSRERYQHDGGEAWHNPAFGDAFEHLLALSERTCKS